MGGLVTAAKRAGVATRRAYMRVHADLTQARRELAAVLGGEKGG